MDGELFSPDYATARRRFREAAEAAGAALDALALDGTGPGGERLTIDLAKLGPSSARSVLLHTSGLHGVEGFTGSAIQLKLLGEPPALAEDQAIVFVHAMNPYGMAWLRRGNENNVDLNRNFLADPGDYRGAPEAYGRLDWLLNPEGPPPWCDPFYLGALWAILRYGYADVKQAVAGGQYEFPRGLFFGGRRLEEGPRRLVERLAKELEGTRHCAAIDVHTGLGPYGEDSLLVPFARESEEFQRLSGVLGERAAPFDPADVAYRAQGTFQEALRPTRPEAEWTCVLQEFGTFKPVTVLKAMRDENRWHHFGRGEPLEKLAHPVKARLLRAFCPGDPWWRRHVVERGHALALSVARDVLAFPTLGQGEP